MNVKKCSLCKKTKSLKEYWIRRDRKEASRSCCIECGRKQLRDRYKKNPNKYRELRKRNYHKYREKNLLAQKKYWATPKAHLDKYRRNAKKRGIKFELTISDINRWWGHSCGYCGEDIKMIGLDRLDSEGGYTPDNVSPCCKRCNVAKLTETPSGFVRACRAVADRFPDNVFIAPNGKLYK